MGGVGRRTKVATYCWTNFLINVGVVSTLFFYHNNNCFYLVLFIIEFGANISIAQHLLAFATLLLLMHHLFLHLIGCICTFLITFTACEHTHTHTQN
jgi:hypothetical protein